MFRRVQSAKLASVGLSRGDAKTHLPVVHAQSPLRDLQFAVQAETDTRPCVLDSVHRLRV